MIEKEVYDEVLKTLARKEEIDKMDSASLTWLVLQSSEEDRLFVQNRLDELETIKTCLKLFDE